MAEKRKYLLDANILIEAHKRYYGFDLCPGFWEALIRQHRVDRVYSIDRVKREIDNSKKDKLADWAKTKAPKAFFKNTDSKEVIEQFARMVAWVQDETQYRQEAKDEFASVADGWLIAFAKAEGLVVVTDEVFNPEIRKKVKIPNVCRQFTIECVNTFQMLRELGIRFVEQPPK